MLMDDAAIAGAQPRRPRRRRPTDVLSYPTRPDDSGFPQVPHLGDVLISPRRRSGRQAGRVLLHAEVLTLAAHGLAHLRGFDHQTEASGRPSTPRRNACCSLRRCWRPRGGAAAQRSRLGTPSR